MGPDETLCLKVDDVGKGDEGRQNAEWYNAIMSVLIPSRVLRLGRPIQPQEFFECAWDVEVVNAPKIKRPGRSEEPLQNICVRLPEIAGQKRLCFYAHTIVICKRRIEPTVCGTPPSGIPPFHIDDFIEIPRKCVAFFGCQERFFLMRLGRGAPMGASELWAQCDSEEAALDIHNKLNVIIERESEKKRKMNNGIKDGSWGCCKKTFILFVVGAFYTGEVFEMFSVIMPPGLLSLRSYHTHHRERPHTQPLRQRASSFFNGRVGSLSCASNNIAGRKTSDSSGPGVQALGNRASSISHDYRTQSGNNLNVRNLMSVFPNQEVSTSLSFADTLGVYQQMKIPSNAPSPSSNPTSDETENSGSTICAESIDGSQCGVTSNLQHLLEKKGGTCEVFVVSQLVY
ncbi:hypothetical protein DICVIV_12514 [Dictyocaulus viviparus]|uniref:Uncharacterized protein n=1 Tax=Dictyocaulus viviparus TaxID=29172 RepID=A0A0D8XGK8_DICVI|nr:hypothetical protein DICVIV_12514 [Dictyocaulus viviparus]